MCILRFNDIPKPVQSNARSVRDHSIFYTLYALLFDVLQSAQHTEISRFNGECWQWFVTYLTIISLERVGNVQ